MGKTQSAHNKSIRYIPGQHIKIKLKCRANVVYLIATSPQNLNDIKKANKEFIHDVIKSAVDEDNPKVYTISPSGEIQRGKPVQGEDGFLEVDLSLYLASILLMSADEFNDNLELRVEHHYL